MPPKNYMSDKVLEKVERIIKNKKRISKTELIKEAQVQSYYLDKVIEALKSQNKIMTAKVETYNEKINKVIIQAYEIIWINKTR